MFKPSKLFILLFVFFITAFLFVSCSDDEKEFTVTFNLDGGNIVSGQLVQKVSSGNSATPPTVKKEGYTFDTWEGDYTNVSNDVTIIAKWKELFYTYTFFDEDGITVLKTEKVQEGTIIVPPDNPTKPSNEEVNYEFNGWNGFTEGMKITKDISFVATFISSEITKILISFDVDGGLPLESMTIPQNTSLKSIPSTLKEGNIFVNWYLDKEFTLPLYNDTIFNTDTILYAKYEVKDLANEIGETKILLEEQDSSFSFTVVGNIELTNNNYQDYIVIQSFTGIVPTLKVEKSNEKYTLSPMENQLYQEGCLYSILLDDCLTFDGKNKTLRQYNIRIRKPEVSDIALKEGIKYRLLKDVSMVGEYTYFILDTEETKANHLVVGDILCIWDGEYNENTNFIRIGTISKENKGQLIYGETVSFDDVCENVDFYIQQDIPLSAFINEETLERYEKEIKSGEGVKELTRQLAKKMNESTVVQQMMFINFEDYLEENPGSKTISIEDLIPGLTVSCTFGTGRNDNFDLFNNFDWSVITIELNYDVVIKNKIKIKANLTIKEYLYVFVKGVGHQNVNLFNVKKTYFDYNINFLTETEIDFTVLVCSTNSENEEYRDISKEMEDLMSGDKTETPDNLAAQIQEMLENESGEIELLSVPLFETRIDFPNPIPILEASFNLDLVIKLNFAAGISSHVSVLSGYQVGFNGTADTGMSSYSNQIEGNTRYGLEASAYGYVGIMIGFKAGAYMSFIGCSDIGKIGVYGEIGAYVDVYGYLNLKLQQRHQWGTPEVTSSFVGGLYIEVGIYIDIGIEVASDVFKAKAGFSIVKEKFKIFDFGNQYVLLEMIPLNEGQIIVRNTSFNVKEYLQGKFLDLKTGKVTTESLVGKGDISVYAYKADWTYNDETDTLSIKEDAPFTSFYRCETPLYVLYEGGNLQFNASLSKHYIFSKLNVLYVTPDIGDNIDASYKATYMVDLGDEQIYIGSKQVTVGTAPGPYHTFYELNGKPVYMLYNYLNTHLAIFSDTTYFAHYRYYQYVIKYQYYDGTDWCIDYYAVSMNANPSLPPTSKYKIDNGELDFVTWSMMTFDERNREWVYKNVDTPTITTKSAISLYNYRYNYLDTTKPLYSFKGDTLQEAINKEIDANVPYNTVETYTGIYNKYQFKVDFVSGNYTNEPVDFNNPSPSINIYSSNYEYGNYAYVPAYDVAIGYEIIGWDRGNDGTIDFPFGSKLAMVEGNDLYVAVYQKSKCEVKVVDYLNRPIATEILDYGDTPTIVPNKLDDYQDENKYYQFKSWEVVYNYGSAFEYKPDMMVGSKCTIRPVYNVYYKVSFVTDQGYIRYTSDYDNNEIIYQGNLPSYSGDEYEVGELFNDGVFMIRGDHSFSLHYLFITLEKAKDNEYSYKANKIFIENQVDEAIELSINGTITITESCILRVGYEKTENQYHVTYKTAYGKLPNGQNEMIYEGNYQNLCAFQETLKNGPTETSTSGQENEFKQWYLYYSNPTNNTFVYNALFYTTKQRYNVVLNWGSGTFDGHASAETIIVEHETDIVPYIFNDYYTLTPPTDKIYVYDFVGYRTSDGILITKDNQYLITKNESLTAEYLATTEKVEYTITLNPGIGCFSDGSSKSIILKGNYNDPVILPNEDPIGTNSLVGYEMRFVKWSVYEPSNINDLPTVFDGNYLLIANYERSMNSYTLTYYLDGSLVPYATQTYHYGDIIIYPETPQKEGYCFTGWNDWSIPESKIMCFWSTKDAYVNGYFVQEKGYEINYFSDGVLIETEYSASDMVVVPRYKRSLVKEGYTFIGWDSNDVRFEEDNSFIMPTSNINLEAVWHQNELYISDGITTESIYEFGNQDKYSELGYTYTTNTYSKLNDEYEATSEDVTWGELLIVSDGLTISGYASNITIIIESYVTNCTFNNLVIANNTYGYEFYIGVSDPYNDYGYWYTDDSVIKIRSDSNEASPLELSVKGDNAIYSDIERGNGINSLRDLVIIGENNAILNVITNMKGISTSYLREYIEEGGYLHLASEYLGSLTIKNLRGSINTYDYSLFAKGMIIDNCIFNIVSRYGCMIVSNHNLTINDSTIKGSGLANGIRVSNTTGEKVELNITGLTKLNIKAKQYEAIYAEEFIVYDDTIIPENPYYGYDIVFDLESGSRIVLVGGNLKYREPLTIYDLNNQPTSKCWAMVAKLGKISLNECKVNGLTNWQLEEVYCNNSYGEYKFFGEMIVFDNNKLQNCLVIMK